MKFTRRTSILLILVVVMLAGASVVLAQGSASSPTSSTWGVTPYIIAGANQGGNRTCAEVGTAFFGNADYYEFSSERVNYNDGAFGAAFPAGLTVFTDGTSVNWSSTFGIGAVIVKGSNDANVYVYDPQRKSDSGLASPPNASGGSAGLSNITFCWNPEPVEEGQWCSPGYWRNHPAAWAATGYSQSDNFAAAIGYTPARSPQGVRSNAPTNPTLGDVVNNPQWYGGEAFNAVGDLLSAAHPDVNFLGERIEDSCPLN